MHSRGLHLQERLAEWLTSHSTLSFMIAAAYHHSARQRHKGKCVEEYMGADSRVRDGRRRPPFPLHGKFKQVKSTVSIICSPACERWGTRHWNRHVYVILQGDVYLI